MVIVNHIPVEILEEIDNAIRTLEYYERQRLGSGSFGAVYNIFGYAVKVFTYSGGNNRDPRNLEKLKGNDLFPKIYAYDDQGTYMISELINGKVLEDINEQDRVHPLWEQHLIEGLERLSTETFLYPSDIHSTNAMIDSNTGLIRIVDVGAFWEGEKSCSEDWYDWIPSYFGGFCKRAKKMEIAV